MVDVGHQVGSAYACGHSGNTDENAIVGKFAGDDTLKVGMSAVNHVVVDDIVVIRDKEGSDHSPVKEDFGIQLDQIEVDKERGNESPSAYVHLL